MRTAPKGPSPTANHPLINRFRKRESGIVTSVLRESQVVLATCHSAGSRQLYTQAFDVVIIDEATQAIEAVCWVPIFKARKLVLAGDPMQLPPTVLSLDKERKKREKKGAKGAGSRKGEEKAKAAKAAKDDKVKDKEEATPATGEGGENDEDEEAEGSDEGEGEGEGDAEDKGEEAHTPQDEVTLKPKWPVELRPPHTLETTLFDRLEKMYGPGIKRMLQVQYR